MGVKRRFLYAETSDEARQINALMVCRMSELVARKLSLPPNL